MGRRAKTRQTDIEKCDTQALFVTHRIFQKASYIALGHLDVEIMNLGFRVS